MLLRTLVLYLHLCCDKKKYFSQGEQVRQWNLKQWQQIAQVVPCEIPNGEESLIFFFCQGAQGHTLMFDLLQEVKVLLLRFVQLLNPAVMTACQCLHLMIATFVLKWFCGNGSLLVVAVVCNVCGMWQETNCDKVVAALVTHVEHVQILVVAFVEFVGSGNNRGYVVAGNNSSSVCLLVGA